MSSLELQTSSNNSIITYRPSKELESSSFSNARLGVGLEALSKSYFKTGAGSAREHPVYLEQRPPQSARTQSAEPMVSRGRTTFGLSGPPVLLRPLSTIFLEVAAEFNLRIR